MVGSCMDDASNYEMWFTRPYSERLLQEITKKIQQVDYGNLQGRFLQIGNCGINPWLEHLNFSSKWLVNRFYGQRIDAISLETQLPLPNNCIDVIFAPFLCDQGVQPELLVHELDRVLASMGLVILLGLNPTSLWRLSRFFSLSKKQWYQSKHQVSAWKLERLFANMNFTMVGMDFFYYIPPFKNIQLIRYFDAVNTLSKVIAFYPPSFYFLVMQKREESFTGLLTVEKNTWC